MSASVHPRCFRDITPVELAQGPRGRLIDVREPHELAGELGHLAGAELVPLGTLATVARGWSRDEELTLVCRSGNRSAQAAALLCQLGFRRLWSLAGGMLAVRAGGPSARGAQP